MASALVVLVLLVAVVWLSRRAPTRGHGCCGGPWPPDDLRGAPDAPAGPPLPR